MTTVFHADAPEAVLEYIEGAIRMPDYRADALDLAERRLGIDRQQIDRALVRAKWAARWRRSERSKTLAIVEQAVNRVLENDHIGRLVVDRRFTKVPEAVKKPNVVDGVLNVRDAERTTGSVYVRSFLEVTPPEVAVRAVHVAALNRQNRGLKTDYPFPLGWDVTAGSGTVRRVLGVLGGNVVSSDLTPLFTDVKLDIRRIGQARHHQEPFVRRAPTAREDFAERLARETVSVNKPHIIFIDPPSRGYPSHQELYGGGSPAAQERGLDLAELDRVEWVSVVGGAAVLALGYIARGGTVSLLVREGRRERERVFPESGVAEEVLAFVRGRMSEVVVLDDLRVAYDPVHTCNQRSLGASRLPMRHLVLGREATS